MNTPTLLQYPAGSLLRVSQICRDPKTGRPGLVPWVQRTWLKKAERGEVPPGRKIGAKTRVWSVEEVLATCASLGTSVAAEPEPESLKKARAVRAGQIEKKRQADALVGA